jgi:hypothetical protein
MRVEDELRARIETQRKIMSVALGHIHSGHPELAALVLCDEKGNASAEAMACMIRANLKRENA